MPLNPKHPQVFEFLLTYIILFCFINGGICGKFMIYI